MVFAVVFLCENLYIATRKGQNSKIFQGAVAYVVFPRHSLAVYFSEDDSDSAGEDGRGGSLRRNDTTRSFLGRGSSVSGGATRGETSNSVSWFSSTFAAMGQRIFGNGANDRSLDEVSAEPEINEVVDSERKWKIYLLQSYEEEHEIEYGKRDGGFSLAWWLEEDNNGLLRRPVEGGESEYLIVIHDSAAIVDYTFFFRVISPPSPHNASLTYLPRIVVMTEYVRV